MPRTADIFAAAFITLATITLAHGDTLASGRAAYVRGDYVRAARLLFPLAARGNARAQMLLGFMYANGQGVPQAYDAATYWYHLAAEQGDTTAQYLLGLMFDKGHGVPVDEVIAFKWLNLAAAGARRRDHERYARLRDAVASKMSRGQIAEGQWLSLQWVARPRY